MLNINNHTTYSKTKYFVTILLVIFSAYATDFSRSPFGQLVGLIIILFIFKKYNYQLTNDFLKINFAFFTIIILQSLYTASFHPLFIFRIYISLMFAYFALSILGKELFFYLEKVVYVLALISLPLFLLQLLDFNLLYQINEIPETILPFLKLGGEEYSNSIIFTMKPITAPFRNSGFSWEPGAFAAFLAIPIAINITTNQKIPNKKLIVLLIALLTTFSTMGYLLILFFLLLYLINSRVTNIWLYLALYGIPILFFVFQLSFVRGKLFDELNTSSYTVSSAFSTTNSSFISLGRIGSFILDFEDFRNYPILGIGGNSGLLTTSFYTRLQRTNGLSDYLVTFGAVGMIILILNLKKSFQLYLNDHNKKGAVIFILLILSVTFSNSILLTPLFIGFQLFYLVRR